jgi:hypothetical protein
MRPASAEIAAPFVVETLGREGSVWVRESSDSMGPLLRRGDRLRLAPVERAQILPGTLVAYHGGPHLIVHRVLACIAAGVVTKGDALDHRDEPVAWEAIVARVVTIEGPRGRRIELTAAPWPALGRLLAGLSRRADAHRARATWLLLRLPFHLVAWIAR